MTNYQNIDSQKSHKGNYFWLVILVPIIVGLFWVVPYLIEQEAIKSKIRDYEVQSFVIDSKKIQPETKTEYYNCITTSKTTPMPFSIAAEAAKKPAPQGSTKPAPKAPNPKDNSNTSDWYKPKESTKSNQIKSDSLKQNPIKTGDNSNFDNNFENNFGTIFGTTINKSNNNKSNTKKNAQTKCQERYYTVYDYIMEDSGGQKYYFGYNLASANLNPFNWSSFGVGDSIAKIKEYENYFLSGIDPIFSPAQSESLSYSNQLPDEPKVYGQFDLKIDQVWQYSENVFESFGSDDMKYFNQELMNLNSFLNAKPQSKQVNLRIFIVPDDYDDYLRQLCIKWKGCNKNDLIFTIQLSKDRQISRVQGYSWSPTGYDIAIELDSELVATKRFLTNKNEFDYLISQIKTKTKDKFVRQEMKEYKYIREALERQIKRERSK